ncbi:WD40-repeat-containing domain protein [Syncephalis plumigaleata]|nr:WD40-repeat-containing domain protein [Syncephalis plumigaleata]
MKVKTISRSADDYQRARRTDLHRVQRNLDPTVNPFEQAREYTRALNAAKLERMFAKPFVGALSGHADGVYCMAKHPTRLDTIISGSGDGEVRLWSLSSQSSPWKTSAHRGVVYGVCAFPQLDRFISVGMDKTVKLWSPHSTPDETGVIQPVNTFVGKNAFSGVDHHRRDPIFATSGSQVDIWDLERSEPITTFEWGSDTINTVKFNQSEVNVLASCGSDRTIILYDLRSSAPLAKQIMQLRTNAIAWNPREPFNFVAANEDHNCYMFDMRRLDNAVNVFKDHVSAVMDVDFSPTGEEIVTGSYDRSLRIFNVNHGHSRDIYHTKRMQRIFCVKYSMDSKYVLSGSDDGNIRLWKAVASEKIGPVDTRERTHMEYQEKLKDRYRHLPQVKKVLKHRLVPKAITTASKTKRIMLGSRKRKEENERKHSKPGTVPHKAERKKHIITVEK